MRVHNLGIFYQLVFPLSELIFVFCCPKTDWIAIVMLEIGVQSFYRSFSIALLRIRIGFSADPDPAFFVDADPDPGPGF
jgi:hypothetical protein